MREVLRLSNSEMADWRRCRRRWYLGTYRRLTKRLDALPGSPLSTGDLVHQSLAAYYNGQGGGPKVDPVAFVNEHAAAESKAHPTLVDAIEKERELAVIMLEGYFEWLAETGADAELKVLGVETEVDVLVVPAGPDGREVRLISKLDVPVMRESDGARLALEHKTVASLDQPLPLLKIDSQMLTEHLARFMHLQEEGATADQALSQAHGILYNMLRKVKRTARANPPFYGRETIRHNLEELRNHWRHVLAIARDIQQAEDRLDAGESHQTVCPPSPRRECTWDCDFFRVCVMHDDGSNVEGAIEAMYEERDPLERYAGAEKLVDAI